MRQYNLIIQLTACVFIEYFSELSNKHCNDLTGCLNRLNTRNILFRPEEVDVITFGVYPFKGWLVNCWLV